MAVYTTKICMRAKFFWQVLTFRREMMVGLRFAFFGGIDDSYYTIYIYIV